MADTRRRSYRIKLAALVLLGALPIAAACGHDLCRSGDPTLGCSQQVGGLELVTTCDASDDSGEQACVIRSQGRTLDVLCGPSADPATCSLSDGAQRTAGITEDTTGILLDGGTLTLDTGAFEMGAFPSGIVVEILAASVDGAPAPLHSTRTPCNGCDEMIPIGADYAWVTVAILPAEAMGKSLLSLSGKGIEIDDLRLSSATVLGRVTPGCDMGCNVPSGGNLTLAPARRRISSG
jgi:hypothetical protein